MYPLLCPVAAVSGEVIPAAPSLGTGVALVYGSTFSLSGFSWQAYFREDAAYPPTRSETGVLRFEIRSGDYPSDEAGHGTERCEINHIGALDQTRTITFSYLQMIEAGAAYTTTGFCILPQFHAVEDALDVHTSPPWAMNLTQGDVMQSLSRGSAEDPLVVTPSAAIHGQWRQARGVWTRWAHEFKWDAAGTNGGYLKVWRNGVQVVDYHGAIGYQDVSGPSPQLGIYRAPNADTMVVYYADVSLGYA